MNRVAAVVGCLVALVAGDAAAGTLKVVGDKTYTGTIVGIEGGNAVFIWQQDKDQPEKTRRGKGEMLFEAQGAELQKRIVPLSDIESVDGIPISAYPSLYGYNVFYRVLNDLDGARIQAGASGDFVNQVKGIGIFLALMFLGVPIVIVLLGMLPLAGDRISYGGAILLVLLLTGLGLGAGFIARFVAVSLPSASAPPVQVGVSVALVLLFGFVIRVATRFNFWQGLVFTAAWAGSLFAVSRVVLIVVGLGPQTHQIY